MALLTDTLTPERGLERASEVQYSADVMEEIRGYVMAGFRDLPRGGLEVGGVLFGRSDRNRIEVQAWRPVECEHSGGPRFLLSPKDEAGLARILHAREARVDMEALGWFRSTRNGEVSLLPEDSEFHKRHFPYPSQVVLVLRPANLEPVRARFFRRKADLTAFEAASPEFTLRPAAKRLSEANSTNVTEPETPKAPPVKQLGFARRRVAWWKLTTVALSLLLAASAGATALGLFDPSKPEQLALTVAGREGQLLVAWDASARVLRDADKGLLEIVTGPVVSRVDLNGQQLRRGSYLATRAGGDTELRLTVYHAGKASLHEVTRLVEPPPAEPEVSTQQSDELSQAIERLNGELRAEKQRSQRLQQTNDLLWKQLRSAGVQ